MSASQSEALKQKLAAERAKLWDAVAQLAREDMELPGDGGWSVKDILAHLAFAESVNVKFAKLMVAQAQPVQIQVMAEDFPDYAGPFSLDGFNAYMFDRLRAQSLDEVLTALRTTRADTLAWMENLTPEQLERSGQHAAWGDQNVRGMLRVLALHDKMHAQDIKRMSH